MRHLQTCARCRLMSDTFLPASSGPFSLPYRYSSRSVRRQSKSLAKRSALVSREPRQPYFSTPAPAGSVLPHAPRARSWLEQVFVLVLRYARDDNSSYSQPPLLPCEPIRLDAITDAELADGFGQIIADRALR